ncbi:HAD family hydrolase [Paenibacillus sp. GP183]|uniref:HAD family hydrolase n=1 Tax=Paenibacillus sp. GP183 TaxID=1882751 RepID=UPI00089CD9E6|nr:HAD family hydrolase [Paenibacillus sp. GP183]SEB56274.1 phosphoglycolate phosphatase/pyrophosphatase PpaX [Paenibacillus sp. GP183]
MTIKSVLFDFDGTLADTLPLTFCAFRSVFQKYENKLMNNEEIINTFGPTEEEIIKLNITNKELVDSAIEHYYEIYENHFHEMVKMPSEIVDLIKDLFRQNIKMAIITGKSRRCLDICLKNFGISDFFIMSITGDEVTKPKPDPEGIFKAIQLMDLRSHEVVFVGDSNADIMAGKSANILTIGANWFETVQTTNFLMEPDHIFTRTEDLKSLINKMKDM